MTEERANENMPEIMANTKAMFKNKSEPRSNTSPMPEHASTRDPAITFNQFRAALRAAGDILDGNIKDDHDHIMFCCDREGAVFVRQMIDIVGVLVSFVKGRS